MVRRAVPAAALLGATAFLYLGSSYTLPPFADVVRLMGVVASFAGFWLLMRDPVMANPRERGFLIAAGVAALATWLIPPTGPYPATPNAVLLRTLGLLCTMALVALPFWLLATWERILNVAAAVLAVLAGAWMVVLLASSGPLGLDAVASAQQWIALGGAAAGAWLLAWRLSRASEVPGQPAPRRRRKPHVAIAWNPPTLSERERTARLARLEDQFKSGEIQEHEYWDRRQELEA